MGAVGAVAIISRGKTGSSGTSETAAAVVNPPVIFDRISIKALLSAVAIAWGAVPFAAIANPVGGVAIVGQASMSTQGNKLTVTTQNGAGTSHSAINWQSFSIPAGNTTYLKQPSAASTVINRVVTNTPSVIFGTLGSNGIVVLVNQSGIGVGAGAVVDTAGFTASSLRMTDADALAGRMETSGKKSLSVICHDLSMLPT